MGPARAGLIAVLAIRRVGRRTRRNERADRIRPGCRTTGTRAGNGVLGRRSGPGAPEAVVRARAAAGATGARARPVAGDRRAARPPGRVPGAARPGPRAVRPVRGGPGVVRGAVRGGPRAVRPVRGGPGVVRGAVRRGPRAVRPVRGGPGVVRGAVRRGPRAVRPVRGGPGAVRGAVKGGPRAVRPARGGPREGRRARRVTTAGAMTAPAETKGSRASDGVRRVRAGRRVAGGRTTSRARHLGAGWPERERDRWPTIISGRGAGSARRRDRVDRSRPTPVRRRPARRVAVRQRSSRNTSWRRI